MTSTSQANFFRENALKELNNIHAAQNSLIVVESKFVAYLLVALCALLAATIWAFYGKIEMEVAARGIILPIDNIRAAERNFRNYRSAQEDLVVTARYLLTKKQELYKNHFITIEELEKAKLAWLSAQENIFNTAKFNTQNIEKSPSITSSEIPLELGVLLFVNYTEGKKISAGMSVYLLPSTMSHFEYGYIKAKVIEVSKYPISKELAYTYLGNMNLIDNFFSSNATYLIIAILEKDQYNPSGLKWTTHNGPSFRIDDGTTVEANIISHQCHPYQLLKHL